MLNYTDFVRDRTVEAGPLHGASAAYSIANRLRSDLAVNITRVKAVVTISRFNHGDSWILGGREGEGTRDQAQEIQRFGHNSSDQVRHQ
jgi:hypothetical protein